MKMNLANTDKRECGEFKTSQNTIVLTLIFDASHRDLKQYVLLLLIN